MKCPKYEVLLKSHNWKRIKEQIDGPCTRVHHLNDIALVIKRFSKKFTSISHQIKDCLHFLWSHFAHRLHLTFAVWAITVVWKKDWLDQDAHGSCPLVYLSTCLLVLVSGHRVPYLRQAIFPTCFLVHSMHTIKKGIALQKLHSLCHKSDFKSSWMDDIRYKYVTLFMASDLLVNF